MVNKTTGKTGVAIAPKKNYCEGMKPKQWLVFVIVIIGARFLYELFGDDFVAVIGGLLIITFFWYTHEIASIHKSAGDSYWLWFLITFTFAGLLVPIYLFQKLTKSKEL